MTEWFCAIGYIIITLLLLLAFKKKKPTRLAINRFVVLMVAAQIGMIYLYYIMTVSSVVQGEF